jgi:hypothetical protein
MFSTACCVRVCEGRGRGRRGGARSGVASGERERARGGRGGVRQRERGERQSEGKQGRTRQILAIGEECDMSHCGTTF